MYKRLELTRLEGLGFTQDDLAFMQSSYRESIGALAQLAGDLVIVTGLTDLGATYSAGWVSISGELLPIAAGVKTTNIIVSETVSQAAFADGFNKDVYYIKVAQLANVGGNPIANFKRLRSLKQLDNDLLTEVTNRTNGDATNAGNIALKVSKAGDSMTGALAMGTNKITGLGNGTNAQDAVTKAQLDAAVNAIINGSPAALDTLIELAAAMGNDANFSTTVTALIATKVPQTRQVATSGGLQGGGALTGDLNISIANSGVDANKIASDAVITAKILNSNVTTAKIADNNVTTSKIADANITDAKLASKFMKAGDGVQMLTKSFSGSWNMDSTSAIFIAHGLSLGKIIGKIGTITNNAGNQQVDLSSWVQNTNSGDRPQLAFGESDATQISIRRTDASALDGAGWNAATYELIIFYKP